MWIPLQLEELKLHPLEKVLIAPIIPFITIGELPVGGQWSIKGNVCYVPVDVAPTINKLPHILQDTQTISVKLKLKKSYNIAAFTQNV